MVRRCKLDPSLKALGFKILIVKKEDSAYNLNLVFLACSITPWVLPDKMAVLRALRPLWGDPDCLRAVIELSGHWLGCLPSFVPTAGAPTHGGG